MRRAWVRTQLDARVAAWRAPEDAGDVLGEGPLWHPGRAELFWCDIEGCRIRRLDPALGLGATIPWPRRPSALGWIGPDALLVADEAGLQRLDLRSLAVESLAAFPPGTGLRSNDGRTDPWGGFWIGTMHPEAREGAGALWRWTAKEGLRRLRDGVTVPNACAFAGRDRAFFADSPRRVIEALALDGEGWLAGAAPFAEVEAPALPDGATVDAEGFLWNAQWDAARLVRYAPDGRADRMVQLPVPRPTCPAFGGPALDRLFVTTARKGMGEAALAAAPYAGALLELGPGVTGRPEPAVRVEA